VGDELVRGEVSQGLVAADGLIDAVSVEESSLVVPRLLAASLASPGNSSGKVYPREQRNRI
jgi:hypothetical protein